MRSYSGKSSGGYTRELGSRAIQQQECGLVGFKSALNALENLPGGIGEFVVCRRHGPDLGDRSQDGKEAEEFRILIHHRRSDGLRQSNYNIAPGLGQPMKL